MSTRPEDQEDFILKAIDQLAISMLKQKLDLKFISSITGLSTEQLLKLKHKTELKN
jgi:hypothetical protein